MNRPPNVIRNRKREARYGNMQNLNEYGIPIPSTNLNDYEPDLEGTFVLVSEEGRNTRHQASIKRNEAIRAYKAQRKAAMASYAPPKSKKAPNKNRPVARSLFRKSRKLTRKSRR